MHRSFVRFAAVVLAGSTLFAPALHAAPPTDAQIDAAIKAYAEKESTPTEPGRRVTAATRAEWADQALADIDLTSASLDQISDLVKGRVLLASSKGRPTFERLGELAKADTAEGAYAAAIRLGFQVLEPDASAQQAMYKRALTHPGLKDALKAGKAWQMFTVLRGAGKDLLPEIRALEPILSPDMPPEVAARAHMAVDAIVSLAGDEDLAAREPMRVKTLAMARQSLTKDPKDPLVKEALENAVRKLDGAFMKGSLVGGPAPDLNFTWSTLDPAVKSLADLRGKVVVLDFWATWCGPCLGSFPDTKELQERYQNYNVVILGITSLQGVHVIDGKATDCKDDPAKETGLMPDFIKAKGMTWKVAFTSQNVFNPEYGITGIPHLVVIDSKGVVRYRKLHPNSKVTPTADLTTKIDGLLKEAGMPVPPALAAPTPAK